MRLALVVLLTLGTILHVAAAPAAPPHRPTMTGEQLVRDMLADPREGANSIRREKAMGYIAGVMDSAAGVTWCTAGKAVPHELDYAVAEALAKLPPERLRANAGLLVAAALARMYPCGGKP